MGTHENADKFLQMVCLDKEVSEMEEGKQTLVGNGGVRLSGGQAQRLALARTLCHKRPVLILDDPFSALDRKTERQIFNNIRQISSDTVILLISHRLYLFPETDQVIWIEDGQTQIAPHEEMLHRSEEYARLFNDQKGDESHEE